MEVILGNTIFPFEKLISVSVNEKMFEPSSATVTVAKRYAPSLIIGSGAYIGVKPYVIRDIKHRKDHGQDIVDYKLVDYSESWSDDLFPEKIFSLPITLLIKKIAKKYGLIPLGECNVMFNKIYDDYPTVSAIISDIQAVSLLVPYVDGKYLKITKYPYTADSHPIEYKETEIISLETTKTANIVNNVKLRYGGNNG